MKITNRKGLPEIIVRAVQNDPYDAGDSDESATSLIKPAYMLSLERQHKGEYTDDVADRLWALYGSAVHYIIERAATGDDLVEVRFFEVIDGKKISAQVDHFAKNTGDLTDAKLTSAWKVKHAIEDGDVKEWEAQMNIQCYLMESNGYQVNKLQILAMCRDYSPLEKTKSASSGNFYPDQIELIQLKKWSREEQLAFIRSRLAAIASPEPCTASERWQPDPTYALMKQGAKRATAVAPTEEKLKADSRYLKNTHTNALGETALNLEYSIEVRHGANKRCEGYCSVKNHCAFYQEHYAKAEDLPFK